MSNKPNLKSRRVPTPAPPSRTWWQSPLTWVGGFLVAAMAVAIAISVADGAADDPAGNGTETAFAEILGTPLPDFASPDLAIGLSVPTIAAAQLDGERTQVAADGTARLFGFFAHWCPHCQAELPRTAQWLKNNPLPAGVEVLAISTAVDDTADNFPPSAWFEREDWPATVIVDSPENAIANGFGLTSYPYWVATDADGIVVARISGAIDEAQLAELVATLAPDNEGAAS